MPAKSHGMTGTPTYRSWRKMLERCYDQNNNRYLRYGGRGITVCLEWRGAFDAFFADMGLRPDGCSIDRIDSNGPYCRTNCKWSTQKEQQNNRKGTHSLTFQGETLTVKQWSERLGVSASTLNTRIGRGWSTKDILGIKPRAPQKRIKGEWQTKRSENDA